MSKYENNKDIRSHHPPLRISCHATLQPFKLASRANRKLVGVKSSISNLFESKANGNLSLHELTVLLVDDRILWEEFRARLASSKVVTNIGVGERLKKFVDEKQSEIIAGHVKRQQKNVAEKKEGLSCEMNSAKEQKKLASPRWKKFRSVLDSRTIARSDSLGSTIETSSCTSQSTLSSLEIFSRPKLRRSPPRRPIARRFPSRQSLPNEFPSRELFPKLSASKLSSGQSRYYSELPEKLIVEYASEQETKEDENLVIDEVEVSLDSYLHEKTMSHNSTIKTSSGISTSSRRTRHYSEFPEELLVDFVSKHESTKDENFLIDEIEVCLSSYSDVKTMSRNRSITSTVEPSSGALISFVSCSESCPEPIISKQHVLNQLEVKQTASQGASAQSSRRKRDYSEFPRELLVEFVSKDENTEDENVVIDEIEVCLDSYSDKKTTSRNHSIASTVETSSDASTSSAPYLKNYPEPIISKQPILKQLEVKQTASQGSSAQFSHRTRHYSEFSEELLVEFSSGRDKNQDDTNTVQTVEVSIRDDFYDVAAATNTGRPTEIPSRDNIYMPAATHIDGPIEVPLNNEGAPCNFGA